MPELPEVETVRIQLNDVLKGRCITGVEVFHSKTVTGSEDIEERLVGKTIAHIDRVGKLLIISFQEDADIFLLAHLKMTGQFLYVEEGVISGGGHTLTETDVQDLPHRHTRVAFYLDNKEATLYFNDMRLFGYVKVVDADSLAIIKRGFGPEPIAESFPVEQFVEQIRRRQAPVKAVLLDQSFVAGLGNIYVDEALFRAGVRPTRKASRLTKVEARRLAQAAGDVMKESIGVGGTTFQHFTDTDGKSGNFTEYLQVFGRQGAPCLHCQSSIQKIKVAGRGTHYCPHCQK